MREGLSGASACRPFGSQGTAGRAARPDQRRRTQEPKPSGARPPESPTATARGVGPRASTDSPRACVTMAERSPSTREGAGRTPAALREARGDGELPTRARRSPAGGASASRPVGVRTPPQGRPTPFGGDDPPAGNQARGRLPRVVPPHRRHFAQATDEAAVDERGRPRSCVDVEPGGQGRPVDEGDAAAADSFRSSASPEATGYRQVGAA